MIYSLERNFFRSRRQSHVKTSPHTLLPPLILFSASHIHLILISCPLISSRFNFKYISFAVHPPHISPSQNLTIFPPHALSPSHNYLILSSLFRTHLISTHTSCASLGLLSAPAYRWAHMGSCQWVVPVGHATAIIQNVISKFLFCYYLYI